MIDKTRIVIKSNKIRDKEGFINVKKIEGKLKCDYKEITFNL